MISRSPGDLEPVLQTMLENATRICEAKFAHIYLHDGDAFRIAAHHNTPPALVEERTRTPYRPGPKTPLGRMASTKQLVHVIDLAAWPSYLDRSSLVTAVERAGVRTLLQVPMLKENELIGAVSIYRQEVRPFILP